MLQYFWPKRNRQVDIVGSSAVSRSVIRLPLLYKEWPLRVKTGSRRTQRSGRLYRQEPTLLGQTNEGVDLGGHVAPVKMSKSPSG
jgi:hypothetical protein